VTPYRRLCTTARSERVGRPGFWAVYACAVTETQRQSVPSNDDDELDTALAFLSFARRSLVKKLDDLDEEQVRRVLVPTGTSLLGLVRHSTDGERFWFGYHLTGIGSEPNWDEGMTAAAGALKEDVIAEYLLATAASDSTIRKIGDPEATSALTLTGAPRTLRWTMAHMTSETARHAGHADILRELIDGTTGR
jgi:hypothetical protein